ncbi:HlyD family efflux transporter periplasmic adaptor subunit [Scytonema hofmannii FACHB-248]|uniref:HlyD family efflux transporter periplasmic adaptor subunit n=1 Tax=Scytonema hofmannii FACHB-248 TaxID=1842502 RepID=A0ABR8GXM5_9CYAN|nr:MULTISPECIES: HlyD family efflux transporter periplasmic adaptor subunit [Nostocales]MBD2607972.1 HlyD family efflux transporter periplasmic adaptor subunit [Scytonema hofmannii FACHB-248]
MNTDNGNGKNGNEKSSHNGNGTNKNNTSGNGNSHSSIPSLVSIQQLEQLSTPASDIQPKPPNTAPRYVPKFDQPVILKQPRKWSRAILWSLMAVTTGTVIWANLALIEEAVSATGKLEASGATLDVQAPVGGVVKQIFVIDGKQVHLGERLLTLDNTTSIAQMQSLQKIRASLVQENQFYQSELKGSTSVDVTKLKIPTEILDLTRSRATLIAENQVYRTQLSGAGSASKLTLEQRERISSNQAELDTRITAATSQIDQLKRQFQQTDIKLVSTKDTLKMNQGILDNITPLMKDGGISKIQYFKQQEEVRNAQSEIDQLTQEKARLRASIAEGIAKLHSTVAVSRRDWLNSIAENNKKIAEIDSQFTKGIVENNKKIAETDSQISQAKMNLKYQEIKAPANGTIFELKAHTPGFVVTSSEPILKVVPSDKLVAKVYITNKDIGFVKEGMTVDVRIDSFPFSEFGDIKGKLVWIGSDALPPDQIYPFYRFPAKVELETQQLLVSGRNISLQSGMGVSTNIKIRSRTVMSIFTDMFSSSVESLKNVR